MARQRSKRPSQSKPVSQKVAKFEESDSEDDIDIESDSLEKDEEEEELDRLVLGDGFAFKAQLGQTTAPDEEVDSEDEVVEDDGEADIENVDDADVNATSTILGQC